MSDPTRDKVARTLAHRFADGATIAVGDTEAAALQAILARGSCRYFRDDPIPEDWLNLICAAAMSAPTKSDLQQRDIVVLRSAKRRERLAALVGGQAWVAKAPMIAVFCGNNRRQRLLHDWRGVPFANDHLDAFFNAIGDAAIALGAFVTAAEALGLGCCPISAVRNEAQAVSHLLDLPGHVFPFAGLAFGFTAGPTEVSKRLPLGATCHVDTYSETDLRETIDAYDRDRAAVQPYATQRFSDLFGQSSTYGWTEDKVRQYSQPERADFGQFIRAKGFRLD